MVVVIVLDQLMVILIINYLRTKVCRHKSRMGDLSTLTLLLVGQSLLRFVLLLFGFSLKPNLYLHMVSLAAKIFWSRIHYLSGVVWPQTVFQYIQHHMT
jgi:hypothetical protein